MDTEFSKYRINRHESFILVSLMDKPLDRKAIIKEYEQLVQCMGIPATFTDEEKGWTFHRKLESYLEKLTRVGFVVSKNGVYALTESGKKAAEEKHERIDAGHKRLRAFLVSPENASLISVIADAGLASIKLAVGFLFNSMALIADGFDSSIDVFSSLAVFLGIRSKKELASTLIVISMMFGTAGYIFYEAVTRLLTPEPLTVSPFAIAATIISGISCYCLSIYQHYVGKRAGSISLLTQSVDSRNHTIQATAVLAGLIFAFLGVFIVDSIVALTVGFFILKSALELFFEVLRLARGGELEAGRFGRKYEEAFSKQQRSFFKSWVLVALREVESKKEIQEGLSDVFSSNKHSISTLSGFEFEDQLDPILDMLEEEGLIVIRDRRILLTPKGQQASARKVAKAKFGIPF